jgi:hypothetical protein
MHFTALSIHYVQTYGGLEEHATNNEGKECL